MTSETPEIPPGHARVRYVVEHVTTETVELDIPAARPLTNHAVNGQLDVLPDVPTANGRRVVGTESRSTVLAAYVLDQREPSAPRGPRLMGPYEPPAEQGPASSRIEQARAATAGFGAIFDAHHAEHVAPHERGQG